MSMAETSAAKNPQIDVAYHKFVPEINAELAENIGIKHLVPLNLAAALGLGGLFMASIGDKVFPAGAIPTSAIVALMGGYAFLRTAAEVFRQPAIDKIFPGLTTEKTALGIDELKAIVVDKANAVVPEQSEDPLKFKPQSLVSYKKRLILELAKTMPAEETTGALYHMLLAAPNLELKKYILSVLKRYGRKNFSGVLIDKLSENNFANDLDKAAVHSLALSWKLGGDKTEAKKLDILSKNVFWKTAKKVSIRILETVEVPPTLRSFARLFVLRRMKEIAFDGRLLTTEETNALLGQELIQELVKFDRAQRETHYDQSETTTGLEIQPVMGRNPFPLLVDNKEIKQIVRFGKLGSQDDKPFEIRLSPSVNPISQLLTFREVLALTGIPIELAGVQVNFGGIGKDRRNIVALQRVILSAGRLRLPQRQFEQYGDWWTEGSLWSGNIRQSFKRGEIGLRDRFNLEVKRVLPRKLHRQGFGSVAEMRSPVGAKSFYVFSRGLLAAHDLADMVRESEQGGGKDTYWEKLCAQFDTALAKINLPPLKKEWSRKQWREFASITKNPDNELRQTLQTYLNDSIKSK